MKTQLKSRLKTILISFAAIYLAAQLVAPAIGFSLILNDDASCYSGALSYIERANTGNASCGTQSSSFVGFPFVVNFSYNSPSQKVLSLILDSAPLAIILTILVRFGILKSWKK